MNYRIRIGERDWLGGRPGRVEVVRNPGLAKMFPSYEVAKRYQQLHGGEIVAV